MIRLGDAHVEIAFPVSILEIAERNGKQIRLHLKGSGTWDRDFATEDEAKEVFKAIVQAFAFEE